MSTDYAINRAPNRPKLPTFEERLKRSKIVQKCSEFADEIVAFHIETMRDPQQGRRDRLTAGQWVYEQAFGKAKQQVEVDQPGLVRHVHIVRWLPPDPNDTSNVIEPEKD